jgi:hypothetical protein
MFRLGLQWIDYNIRILAKWLAGGNAPNDPKNSAAA